MFSQAKEFLGEGIWKIQAFRLTKLESLFIRTARLFILSFKKFKSDQCYLLASALTFYTLLSIVPLLATAFGMAKGFGLDEALEKRILQMSAQDRVLIQIIEFARNTLVQAQGGIIAGAGILFLLWSVIKVLSQVEQSLNDIWGIKSSRSWSRKFSDYLFLVFICPLLMITAGGATVFITGQIQWMKDQIEFMRFFNPVFMVMIELLPYVLLWGLLTLLYIFMPNTKVKWNSAILGGIPAGTLYVAVQWAYIHFQIQAVQFNAVYGSFAAFPLFLIWVQGSWLIVFWGAEIAYASQNESFYELAPECKRASRRLKGVTALMLTSHCIKHFREVKALPTAYFLSVALELPICLVQEVLDELVSVRILSIVYGENSKEKSYQPGRPLEDLTVKNVLQSLDHAGLNALSISESTEMEKHRDLIERLWNHLQHAPENLPLKDLAAQGHENNPVRFEKPAVSRDVAAQLFP